MTKAPPAGAAPARGRRYPVLFDLVGYTGSGLAHLNWRPFDENVPERAARLMHQQKMGPCIFVFPDCFTCLGGNQYINSSAIGNYADYLTRELIPHVDREFRTLAAREHRGCFGKSSGGYGAIVHGMKYPQSWGAIVNHSGDAYFDFCYLPDWPRTLNELDRFRKPPRRPGRQRSAPDRAAAGQRLRRRPREALPRSRVGQGEAERRRGPRAHGGRDGRDVRSRTRRRRSASGCRSTWTPASCIAKRWKKWQDHDPIHMVGRYARNLRTLSGIYMDCGWRDQYHLHFGARILSRQLAAHGVRHIYEEFDDSHSSIDYRMDISLPFLYKSLKP